VETNEISKEKLDELVRNYETSSAEEKAKVDE
jgi:hypothetical protein